MNESKTQFNKADLWETIKYVNGSLSPLARMFFTVTFTFALICNYSMYLMFLFYPDTMSYNDMLLVCTSSLFVALFPYSIKVLTLLTMERKVQNLEQNSQAQ